MGVVNYLLDNFIMVYELAGLLVLLMISAHLTEQAKKQTKITVAFRI